MDSSGLCGSSWNRSRKRNRETEFKEVIDVDEYKFKNIASQTTTQQDGDDTIIILEDDSDEEANEDLQTSSKLHHGGENSTKAGSFQSTEDEPLSSSVNKMGDFDFSFALSSMRPDHPTKKNHLEQKLKMKKIDQNTTKKSKSVYSLNNSDPEVCVDKSRKHDDGSRKNAKSRSLQSIEDDGGQSFSSSDIESDYPGLLLQFTESNESETDNLDDPGFLLQFTESSESESDRLDDSGFLLQFTESSESENDGLDDSGFLLQFIESSESESDEKYEPHRPATKSQSFMSKSVGRKEEGPSVNKTNAKKTNKKPMDESSVTQVYEKQNAKAGRFSKVGKANPVKYKKYKKGRRRDDAGCVEVILDSIISTEDDHGKEEADCIPLKFRFDDSEDESSSQKPEESNGEALFEEMEFVLTCDEIGSHSDPNVKKRENDDHYNNINLCESGQHGDTYFEEQTGLRCCLCGAVLLESKYVISKLATDAPDKSKTSYGFDGQRFSSRESPRCMDSDSNPYDIFKQTKGTVWELIPTNIRVQMHQHQQEGFEFLWGNLAGTMELSRLQTLGPNDGGGQCGGCIISHAPGTGKTFMTIVFMKSFLKRFPKCCPVIVAPTSMLLTWEAEFKKWKIGFPFVNLHNTELSPKEMIVSSSTHNKDLIRAMKIRSWINGGGVLGVSYRLFETLVGNSNKKNTNRERIRTILLEMPGLVVLDEGHTPRNHNSKIWKTLLKLETKNRVILSGTPFQNNFRELFNTLRLVRPATASSIVKEKVFSDMIQPKNMKKSRGRSSYEDIEKLKQIISPFVHVIKGHILETKLPGLKESVILLNPPTFQKGFIENLGNSTRTFEYDHKVALVSVHPSLILHCSLSEKEQNSINKQELEDVRLQPEVGVKTRFVMELIRLSLSLSEKVLIFSQYIQPSELLQDQITRAFGWHAEKEITLIKGSIHQTRRQQIINVFNDPKSELKVLLASTKCCSEGIHLYGASRVVLLDVVWNPSVEKQAISRAYRLGQKKMVYTYHLMAAGTTEEDKYDRQVEKWRLAKMVFSSASIDGGEPKNKENVEDKILEEMVDNQELKNIFKKVRCLENQTRV